MDNQTATTNYNDNYNDFTKLTGSPKKKHSFFKTLLVIFLVILLLAIAICGVCFYLGTQNNYNDKFLAEPSIDIVNPLLKSVVLGKEQDVTDNNINSLLAFIMKDVNEVEIEEKQPLKITNIAINFHEDAPTNLYIKMDYKGTPLTLTTKADITLESKNKNIVFTVDSAKLGELPVSPTLAFNYFKNTDAYSQFPTEIKIVENKIIIPSGYSTKIYGYDFSLDIVSLTTGESLAKVQTTSVLDSIADIITSYLLHY